MRSSHVGHWIAMNNSFIAHASMVSGYKTVYASKDVLAYELLVYFPNLYIPISKHIIRDRSNFSIFFIV